MKRFLLFLLIVSITKVSFAQSVLEGSVIFKIKNLGFDVAGAFTGLRGSINFDPQNLPGSTFDVSVDAATVNTDNSLRDKHLKEDGYFDVKNYPRISLTSVKITDKNGAYIFTGKLTIKDKTKQISFPFTAAQYGDGYNFKGLFKINRKDFELGGI